MLTYGELERMAESLLGKGRGKRVAKAVAGESCDPAFAKKYPILHAYMTEVNDEEGQRREVSKATVFFDQGCVKASLSDASNESSLYVTLDSLEVVWKALEARLASGEADWRPWQGGGSKKRGKRG
jgi:hypothetical protein